MKLDAPAQSFGVRRGQGNADVHGGFVVRGRLGPDQFLDQMEECGLLAAGAGQQRTHGDGKIGGCGHGKAFLEYFREPKILDLMILRRSARK
jgi:hypothetical protein